MRIYHIDDSPVRRRYFPQILGKLQDTYSAYQWEAGYDEQEYQTAWCNPGVLFKAIKDDDAIIILDIKLLDSKRTDTLEGFKKLLSEANINFAPWLEKRQLRRLWSNNEHIVASHVLAAALERRRRVIVASEYSIGPEAAKELGINWVTFPEPGDNEPDNAVQDVVETIYLSASALDRASARWQWIQGRTINEIFVDLPSWRYHDAIAWIDQQDEKLLPKSKSYILGMTGTLLQGLGWDSPPPDFIEAIRILKGVHSGGLALPLVQLLCEPREILSDIVFNRDFPCLRAKGDICPGRVAHSIRQFCVASKPEQVSDRWTVLRIEGFKHLTIDYTTTFLTEKTADEVYCNLQLTPEEYFREFKKYGLTIKEIDILRRASKTHDAKRVGETSVNWTFEFATWARK